MVTKSQLAVKLSKLKVFDEADVFSEQYPTDSEIAATMLWHAYLDGDIEGKVVADYGAGTGILGIGAQILGAKRVVFIEKDEKALRLLRENAEGEIIQAVIGRDELPMVDVVVMNPPFGTKERHIDRVFLEEAFRHSNVVYSLHKTSTVDYLIDFSGRKGWKSVVLENFLFPIKRSMKFHKKPVKKIKVSLIKNISINGNI